MILLGHIEEPFVAPWLYYALTRNHYRRVCCVAVWRARSRQLSMDERDQVDWSWVLFLLREVV